MHELTDQRGPDFKPLLTIVVPVFNEQDAIQLTHQRIIDVLGSRHEFDLEIVYVEDGSKDQSPALLAKLAKVDQRVCTVFLSRNFGHQPAVTAGLRHAMGDLVG